MATLRVKGTARRRDPGDTPLVVRRRLVDAEGTCLASENAEHSFDLETDSGDRVRIEVDAKTNLEPLGAERAAWSALEAAHEGVFRNARDGLPGPHVVVTLRAAELRDGDVVTVHGHELDRTFDEHVQGLREAPAKVLRAIHASVITRVDAVEDPPPPKTRKKDEGAPLLPPKRISAVWRMALLVGAAVALVATARVPFGPLTLDSLAWALTLIGLAAWVAWLEVTPHFVHVETRASSENRGLLLSFALFPLSASFCLAFGDFAGATNLRQGDPPNASMAVVGCNVASLALLCIGLLWTTRRTRQLLHSLLEAKPFAASGPLDGVWGSVVGTVRDPTPVEVAHEPGPLALAQVTQVESHGSDPDIVTQTERTDGTFFVDAGEVSYEVEPTKAIWATTIAASRRVQSPHDAQITLRIPVGANVLVAGRATRTQDRATAQIAAAGPESLLFFATTANDDARVRCAAVRRRLEVTIAVLVVTAAALVVAAGGLAPRLPPTVLPSGTD